MAVVGATGAVGEAMLAILAERRFPVGELVALADWIGFGPLTRRRLATAAGLAQD